MTSRWSKVKHVPTTLHTGASHTATTAEYYKGHSRGAIKWCKQRMAINNTAVQTPLIPNSFFSMTTQEFRGWGWGQGWGRVLIQRTNLCNLCSEGGNYIVCH
jgi:hypothetical protein